MAIDFRADPIGPRTKGWKNKGPGKTKLYAGWEPMPQYGMGQEDLARHEWDDTSTVGAPPADAPSPPDATPADQPQAFPRGEWPSQPAPAPNERRAAFPTQSVASTVQKPYTDTGSAPLSSAPNTTPVTQTPSPSRTTSAPAPATSAPGAVTQSQGTTATGATGGTQSSNVAATPAPRSGSQAQFIQDMLPIAKRVSQATGIPWQVLIAIPANETGWGSAVFHNNYFGIKDPNGAAARTWEEVNGARVDITDNFATFGGAEESMYGFANFLHQNPRYADALSYLNQNPNDWPTFVQMVHQAGYATAHDWADKVTSIGKGLEEAWGDAASQSPAPQDTQRGQGGVWNTANSAVTNTATDVRDVPQGRPSQFSDATIDKATADQICGPAAAIAFIRANGRNPTLKEAYQLAASRGDWSFGTGMHGVTSEQDLLAAYDVKTHIQYADKNGLDWTQVQDDIANGNSVILDTPGHYYVVDGYNSQNGAYHVGTSGTDLIGGSDWMTAEQINSKYQSQGAVRAAIHMDASQGQRPSVATSSSTTSTTQTSNRNTTNQSSSSTSTTSSTTQTKKKQLDEASKNLNQQDKTNTATSFVRWAYRNGLGIDLPDNPDAIFASSQPIDMGGAKPGDVVVFGLTDGGNAQDVGIYAGGGKMLHDDGGGVMVKDVPTGAMFRRVPGVSNTDLWNSGPSEPPVKSVTPQGGGNYLVAFQDGSHKLMRPQGHVLNPAQLGGQPQQSSFSVQPNSGMGHGQQSPDMQDTEHGEGSPYLEDRRDRPLGDYQTDGDVAVPMRSSQIPNAPLPPSGDSPTIRPPYNPGPTPGNFSTDPALTGQVVQGKPPGTGQEKPRPTMSKKESSYTKRATEDFCKDCSMFRANACTLVKGYIHDKGSCDYFEPAKGGVGAGQDEGFGFPDLTQAPVLGGAIQTAQQGVQTIQQAVPQAKHVIEDKAKEAVSGVASMGAAAAQGAQPVVQAAQRAATRPIPLDQNLAQPVPIQTVPQLGRPQPTQPGGLPAVTQQGGPQPQALKPNLAPAQYTQQQTQEMVRNAAQADVTIGSLIAAPLVGGAAAPIIGARAAGVLGSAAANTLPILPKLVEDIHSGDQAGIKGDLAMVAAGTIAGPISERAFAIAEGLGNRALAPIIARVELQPFGEELIRMLAEDAGSVNYGAIPQAAGRLTRGGLNVARFGGNVARIAGTGFGVGFATQFAAEGSDFATDNHWQSKDYWANVVADSNSAGAMGAVLGIGLGAVAAPLRWGWDHSVDPWVVQRIRNGLEPVRAIKVYDQHGNLDLGETLRVRGSLMQGINGDHQAAVEADIVAASGKQLFGKAGQGYNTAEALAYIEHFKTLNGFNQTQWGRGLPDLTPEQAQWVKQRVTYEEQQGIKLRANGALTQTQDVVTGLGDPGPNVHVYHMFDNDPYLPSGKRAATQSRSWRERVTSQRRASTDTHAPEGTPATLRERLDEYYSDPINNPKVHDSMVDSFEASTFQQERAWHRRNAWNELRASGATVTLQQARMDPLKYQDWGEAKDRWGFGQGADQYRFDPNVANYMNNVTAEPGPYRNALQWVGSVAKGTLFLASPVHLWNILDRSMSLVGGPTTGFKDIGRFADLMFHHILPSLLPNGPRDMLLNNPDLFRRAAAAGLTGRRTVGEALSRNPSWQRTLTMMGTSGLGFAAGGWLNAKRQGMSDDQAFQEAWRWGAVGAGIAAPLPGLLAKAATRGQTEVRAATNAADLMHEVIFNRVLPMAKVGAFDILSRATNGTMDREIATQINNTLGGIDTLKMGRNPWLQDLMRFASVAPDWEEGQIRQLFNAFSGGDAGKFTRMQVVRTVGTYMAQIEMLNQVFNGHPTWQNEQGHQFELETTGIIDTAAYLLNRPDLRSIDPQTGRPQRAYLDPLPSLRWIMQTLGEFGRYGAYWGGRGEQAAGQAIGDPTMQRAGVNLQNRALGDWTQGETPPNPAKTVAQDIGQRVGPAPGMLGTAMDVMGGQYKDWSGQGYIPPGMDTAPLWSKLLTHGAQIAAVGEPALGQSLQQKVNLHDPAKTRWGDAFVEALGLTRAQAVTETQDLLTRQDQLLRMLNVTPEAQAQIQDEHRKLLAQNDTDQQDVFTKVAAGSMSHADAEAKLRDLSKARASFSREKEIRMDYGSLVPPGPEQQKAIQFLMDVYHITEPSNRAADVDNKVNVDQLTKEYWQPSGVDSHDLTGIQRAQRALINDTAAQEGESPDALMDQVKWKSLHTDIRTGATPPMPTLPGMSSDDLGTATTGYLDAGTDPKTGERYADSAQAADAQRTYLDNFAVAHNVNVDSLQQRIRLRLAAAAQPNETQISYENALQAYFDSRDNYKHPEYIGEDGKTLGTPQDWNGPPGHPELGWNMRLAALGAKAAKRSDLAPLYEAKQRGDQQRKVFLLTNQNNDDWEKWYGQQGRNMTEKQWADYQANRTVGYKDLIANGGPADETRRRDKIREIYAAMSPDAQIANTVDVWQNGEYHTLTVRGAYHFILRQNVNGAGRTMLADEQADLAALAATGQAPTLANIAAIGTLP